MYDHNVRRTLTLSQAGDNPLTLEVVKRHLRVESEDDDELIQGLMDAAQNYVDGRDGILGRALLTQQWVMKRERFSWYPYPYAGAPYDYAMSHRDWAWDPWYYRKLFAIPIPLPPLVSIDAFTYTAADYSTQSLVLNTDYRIVDGGGQKSLVLPVFGTTWPATAIEPDAVQITFTCGYENTETLVKERKTVLAAMKLLVGHWYINREAALVAARAAAVDLPWGIDALLAPHRIDVL